ncbi:hypothetical protein [Modicisalibacter radicis]|uniref:hypothetical protein n=1 Tax=Halomonas sp. EAR18 TaxID=2518972 RepID=UPI00109BF93B|nr:hypothetical protein [Halomonas sp. EAR18]
MNKVQHKILEAVGVYRHGRLTYSTFSREHTFDIKQAQTTPEVPASVFARRNNCLVLANAWFRESGMYLSWGTLGGTVLLAIFMYLALIMPWLSEVEIGVSGGLLLVFFLILGIFFSYPLLFSAKSELKLQGLRYVIFNTHSKNVHFVSDVDFQPRSCRWDECTFCIAYSAGSIEGYYYVLKGYLLNEDGSVKDSFSFDDYHHMTSNSDKARQSMIGDLSARFEYVRRCMEEGGDSVEPVPVSLGLKPSLGEAAEYLFPGARGSTRLTFHIVYSIIRTLLLPFVGVQVVGHYFFCRYCRLPQWPQAVIDECGEEIFPKR